MNRKKLKKSRNRENKNIKRKSMRRKKTPRNLTYLVMKALFTFGCPFHYNVFNNERDKGGMHCGSNVSCTWFLDRHLYDHVLFGRHENHIAHFLGTDRVFLSIGLFETVRTYVYVCLWSLFDDFLCRLHVLDELHDAIRRRTVAKLIQM